MTPLTPTVNLEAVSVVSFTNELRVTSTPDSLAAATVFFCALACAKVVFCGGIFWKPNQVNMTLNGKHSSLYLQVNESVCSKHPFKNSKLLIN